VLLGPGGVTLLYRGGDPHRPDRGTWWFTPGGGAEPGETPAQAARRELWEETGQSEVEWGPLVARREVEFWFEGVRYRADEWYWVARTGSLEVSPALVEPAEARAVAEHRWLDPDGVRAVPEPVYPEALPAVLDDLLAGRFPARPWRWVSWE
jgi:8-oxo-dGTP pyrophosphatase MutT (NUDIX family)